MTKNHLLLVILICGFAWAQGELASAQGYLARRAPAQRAGRYRPTRPTMSPYLNLLRNNNGAIPNYYSFVRPQQRQKEFNRREQILRSKQAHTLGKIQNSIQQGQAPIHATGTGSGFMQPGTRSTFMNSSHYYPQAGGVGRR